MLNFGGVIKFRIQICFGATHPPRVAVFSLACTFGATKTIRPESHPHPHPTAKFDVEIFGNQKTHRSVETQGRMLKNSTHGNLRLTVSFKNHPYFSLRFFRDFWLPSVQDQSSLTNRCWQVDVKQPKAPAASIGTISWVFQKTGYFFGAKTQSCFFKLPKKNNNKNPNLCCFATWKFMEGSSCYWISSLKSINDGRSPVSHWFLTLTSNNKVSKSNHSLCIFKPWRVIKFKGFVLVWHKLFNGFTAWSFLAFIATLSWKLLKLTWRRAEKSHFLSIKQEHFHMILHILRHQRRFWFPYH